MHSGSASPPATSSSSARMSTPITSKPLRANSMLRPQTALSVQAIGEVPNQPIREQEVEHLGQLPIEFRIAR